MIYGIGTDIMCINQLNVDYLQDGDPFLIKTFSINEIAEGKLRSNPLVYFAERFSAKEAVYKAINYSGPQFPFSDIEILNKENGKPYVTLFNKAKDFASENRIRIIHISLSYDSEYAVSYAVAES